MGSTHPKDGRNSCASVGWLGAEASCRVESTRRRTQPAASHARPATLGAAGDRQCFGERWCTPFACPPGVHASDECSAAADRRADSSGRLRGPPPPPPHHQQRRDQTHRRPKSDTHDADDRVTRERESCRTTVAVVAAPAAMSRRVRQRRDRERQKPPHTNEQQRRKRQQMTTATAYEAHISARNDLCRPPSSLMLVVSHSFRCVLLSCLLLQTTSSTCVCRRCIPTGRRESTPSRPQTTSSK